MVRYFQILVNIVRYFQILLDNIKIILYCQIFLCFGNEASRDRYVGWMVGLDTNFKKVWRLSKRPS